MWLQDVPFRACFPGDSQSPRSLHASEIASYQLEILMRMSPLLAAAALMAAAITPLTASAQERALGPVDGLDLPPVAIDRVAVGSIAPDFTLAVYRGDTFTLSDLRGSKNVVLVFYRGWW